MTASTDFNMPEEDELDHNGQRQVKIDVVVKDRTLDTVAIAHLVWLIENKSN